MVKISARSAAVPTGSWSAASRVEGSGRSINNSPFMDFQYEWEYYRIHTEGQKPDLQVIYQFLDRLSVGMRATQGEGGGFGLRGMRWHGTAPAPAVLCKAPAGPGSADPGVKPKERKYLRQFDWPGI